MNIQTGWDSYLSSLSGIPAPPIVSARAVEPTQDIWSAYSDPNISAQEFAAIVQRVHGLNPEDM